MHGRGPAFSYRPAVSVGTFVMRPTPPYRPLHSRLRTEAPRYRVLIFRTRCDS